MQTIYQQNLGLIKVFFVALSFLLLLGACENIPQQNDDQNQEEDSTVINENFTFFAGDSADKYIANYYATYNDNTVSADFYPYGDKTEGKNKVMGYKFNKTQFDLFFKDYKELKQLTADTGGQVLIRVQLGLETRKISKVRHPNVIPMLELIVDSTKNIKDRYYPLYPFLYEFPKESAASIANSLDTRENPCRLNVPDTSKAYPVISAFCAIALMLEWNAVPADSVNDMLYLDRDSETQDKRLDYYTFDGLDASRIDSIYNTGKAPYLYLFLGKLEEKGHIPFRTILHIGDKPFEFNNYLSLDEDDDDYFEFSKPCPPYCPGCPPNCPPF